ncbi:LAGLIDADG family homing endonuclease [Streptomyces sp. NPDC059627]
MDLTVPEYAYMFGFLQTDGHLSQQSRQRGRLAVEISAKDIDLLREFQKLTPYNSSIAERTRSTNFAEAHTAAIWSLFSLEARTRINELGLPYGRKSKTIAPPTVEFSRRDHLRGLIDADGSVGFTGKGFPFVSLTTASSAIAAYLREYSKDVTGAERSLKRNARDGVYNVLYNVLYTKVRRSWQPTSITRAASHWTGNEWPRIHSGPGCARQAWIAGRHASSGLAKWTGSYSMHQPSPTRQRNLATPKVLARTAVGSCCMA